MLPRPRRILRFLLKAAATLMFVLGLVLLMMWPVSYWWEVVILVTDPDRGVRRVAPADSPRPLLTSNRTVMFFALDGRLGFEYDHYQIRRPEGYDESSDSPGFIGGFWQVQINDPSDHALGNWRLEWGPRRDIWITSYEIMALMPLPFPAALLLSPALLWLALAYRRRRRTQHRLASGLCLHCGYPWRQSNSAACPECGAARPMVTYTEEA